MRYFDCILQAMGWMNGQERPGKFIHCSGSWGGDGRSPRGPDLSHTLHLQTGPLTLMVMNHKNHVLYADHKVFT